MAPFTIGVLCYGGHPDLAHRCLNSIRTFADAELVQDIVIGLNDVAPATKQVVRDLFEKSSRRVLCFETAGNCYKYPMLRRMLFDANWGVRTPYFMWFDDDSYLTESGVLRRCQFAFEHEDTDVVGRAYRLPNGYRGDQVEWIKRQEWYSGVSVELNKADDTWFPQGGWWAVRTKVLQTWDWPSKELRHRGGDVLFGALIRQQHLRWFRYNTGVAVNADAHGNHSRSPRRGFNEVPLGVDLRNKPVVDHNFPMLVWGLGDRRPPNLELPDETAGEEFPIVRTL